MATYIKTKTGSYVVGELQAEINADSAIVPSCTSIAASDDQLTLEFAAALSAPEETQLDTVISNHTPAAQIMDVAQLPFSQLDGKKLSVHTSYKPQIDGTTTYAVWAGSGDDPLDSADLGGGDLLHFDLTPADADQSIEMHFNATNGRVWIHEGYLKFTDAGAGDCISAYVVANPTPTQQSVNLDYDVDGDGWMTYAGPDLGSHGLAGLPVLIPRSFSHDGDWNYDGVNLTPAAGDGEYKMANVEKIIHHYIHRIPCCGTVPYFTMSSDETTEVPAGYFLRITATNTSLGTWHASVIVEIYRERTVDP